MLIVRSDDNGRCTAEALLCQVNVCCNKCEVKRNDQKQKTKNKKHKTKNNINKQKMTILTSNRNIPKYAP